MSCNCIPPTTCGCCEGPRRLTPREIENRPGLIAISARIGTHGSFLETMKARLASEDFPALKNLTTRGSDDPAIALLDVWATTADVLTFYTERIANEGYLRTATERRSVLELARLTGYRPRPGVAASTLLAFTLDKDAVLEIPAGQPTRSVPSPGDTDARPQTFETSRPLKARAELNSLQPRLTMPQEITSANVMNIVTVYFAGLNLNLHPNDLLLFRFPERAYFSSVRRIRTVCEEPSNDVRLRRTVVELQAETVSIYVYRDTVQAAFDPLLTEVKGWQDAHQHDVTVKALADAVASMKNTLDDVKPLTEIEQALGVFRSQLDSDTRTSGVISQQQDRFAKLAEIFDLFALGCPIDATKLLGASGGGFSAYAGEDLKYHAIAGELNGAQLHWNAAQNIFADDVTALMGHIQTAAGTIAAGRAFKGSVDALSGALVALKSVADVQQRQTDYADLKNVFQTGTGDFDDHRTGKLINKIIVTIQISGRLAAHGLAWDDSDAVFRASVGTLITDINHIASFAPDDVNKPDDALMQDIAGLCASLEQLKAVSQSGRRTKFISAKDQFDQQATGGAGRLLSQFISEIGSSQSHSEGSLYGFKFTARQTGNKDAFVQRLGEVLDPYEAGHNWQAFVQGVFDKAAQVVIPNATTDMGYYYDQVQDAQKLQNDIDMLNLGADPRDQADSIDAFRADAHEAAADAIGASDVFNSIATSALRFDKAISDLNQSMSTGLKEEAEALNFESASLASYATDPPVVSIKGKMQELLTKATLNANAQPPSDTPIKDIADLAMELLNLVKAAIQTLTGNAPGVTLSASNATASEQYVLQHFLGPVELLTGQLTKALTSVARAPVAGSGVASAGLDDMFRKIAINAPNPGAPLDVARHLGGINAKPRKVDDRLARLAAALQQRDDNEIFRAWQAIVSDAPPPEIYVFRKRSALFGYNAPQAAAISGSNLTFSEPAIDEATDWLRLENEQQAVVPGSFIAVKTENTVLRPQVFEVQKVNLKPASDYHLNAKVTEIFLGSGQSWLPDTTQSAAERFTTFVRKTTVELQPEPLILAERTVSTLVGANPGTIRDAQQQPVVNDQNLLGESDTEIELDGLFNGMEIGRQIIVFGERTDLPGVTAAELALVQSVTHAVIELEAGPDVQTTIPLPGDTPHTRIVLSSPLKFSFKRETVQIFGNVVDATHGATTRPEETLGSGNAQQEFQRFALKQPPLTFTAAPTETGVDSTLAVRVNDVLWQEVDSFDDSAPRDRIFVTEIDDDGTTWVTFGNGREGARLPSGTGNVTAVYRSGIGRSGNVKAGAITQLTSKPLGLKDVTNPLRASGGADRDTRDQVRSNAPLGTLALERLVAVRDYQDFARTFAGIGKASAAQLGDASGRFVHVTIAGVDDIPIDISSALFKNFRAALLRAGDPHLRVSVQLRELVLLVMVANVRVNAAYLWEKVEPRLRLALLDTFGFEQRELGQSVALSEVISVMQAVEGVDYVDVDTFSGLLERQPDKDGNRIALSPEGISNRIIAINGKIETWVPATLAGYELGVDPATGAFPPVTPTPVPGSTLRPAQLAIFSPGAPDTLILQQLKP